MYYDGSFHLQNNSNLTRDLTILLDASTAKSFHMRMVKNVENKSMEDLHRVKNTFHLPDKCPVLKLLCCQRLQQSKEDDLPLGLRIQIFP